MTLDPLTFEVGRHTDLWIARHVMEWPVIGPHDRYVDYLERGGVIAVDRAEIFRYGTIPDTFLPSSKMEDAAEVLRKMQTRGWVYTLMGIHKDDIRVVFSKDRSDYVAKAETEPLAICRAVGLAVLSEKESTHD